MQNKCEKDSDKLLVSKILDKQNFCKIKNKITFSDFLNPREKNVILNKVKLEKYFFNGGIANADREILFFYPEKLNEDIAKKSICNFICTIRIILPSDNFGKYEHRDYLSALIKIGIVREKIGDIIVHEKGADIITFKGNANFIKMSLEQLTRFKKAKIDILDISETKIKQEKFEIKEIIVSSMRIDNMVTELAKCSRNKATELIEAERILVNHSIVNKGSKNIDMGNIITIRGKGKFLIDKVIRNTRNDRIVIQIKKYV